MSVVEVMPGPQAEFVLSEARYPGYFAGRRGGKTSASVIKMMKYMVEHPGAYGMYTMPTMGDVDRYLLPKMREFFGSVEGEQGAWHWLEKKAELVFPGCKKDGVGGIVFVRPGAEPESCRGPTLAFAAMDEVGTLHQKDTFEVLQPAVMGGQPGYPHQIWVTGTPNEFKQWMKYRWIEHLDRETGQKFKAEDYPYFVAKMADNPHLNKKDVGDLIEEWGSSRKARQEFEAEFLAVTGIAFELEDGIHRREMPANADIVRVVYGLDLGLTAPTSISEWKMDSSRRLWLTDEFYKRDAREDEWMQWLADRNAMRVMCDPSAGEKQLSHWRQRYGLNLLPASRAKTRDERFNLWRDGLRLRHDGYPNITITPKAINHWNELINLQFKRNRYNEWASDEWETGVSDHAYDSGAYGLSAFQTYQVRPVQFRRVA